MIREALMEPQDTAVEFPEWKPGKILKVEVDGEEHEIALNPYYIYDENGELKDEFTWSEAMALELPDGWRIPTRHEMVEICERLGQNSDGDLDGTLYSATGWAGSYWSSTEYGSTYAYYLYVNGSRAYVDCGRFKANLFWATDDATEANIRDEFEQIESITHSREDKLVKLRGEE